MALIIGGGGEEKRFLELTMLETVELPAGVANLTAGLAHVD